MSSVEETRAGGCQCGAVRYEIRGAPAEIYICHCLECRRQSASAFGISAIVDPGQLRLTRGTPQRWTRPTDSGGRLVCYFCPTCGGRLWHGDPEGSEPISVKGGGLDDPPDLTGVPHIWTRRAMPGVPIPHDAPRFEGEPE